jgi:outer membrane protein assembly factor BamB
MVARRTICLVLSTGLSRTGSVVVLLASLACRESTATKPAVHERWYAQQSGIAYTRPATSGNLVFFGTGDGFIVARDKISGSTTWSTQIAHEPIAGANMAVGSAVLVVPVSIETVGLEATTGRALWRYAAPPEPAAGGPTPQPGLVFRTHIDSDGQTVFIPALGASVSAVDMATGAVRWIWQPGSSASDTATSGVFASGSQGLRVSGDTVFATAWHFLDRTGLTSEAWLVALDRTTGHELWRVVIPTTGGGARVLGAPAVSGGLVIFESAAGHEYAVDRNTRQVAWQYTPNATNGTDAETEAHGGIVYHDGGDQNIYALRASDGSVVWRAPFSTATAADMLVTERRVIFSNGPTLYVLDRATGAVIAAVRQPHVNGESFFASPAAYADGQIFVTVGDGAWSFDEP